MQYSCYCEKIARCRNHSDHWCESAKHPSTTSAADMHCGPIFIQIFCEVCSGRSRLSKVVDICTNQRRDKKCEVTKNNKKNNELNRLMSIEDYEW